MRKDDLYTNIHLSLYVQVGMGQLITVRDIRRFKAHGSVHRFLFEYRCLFWFFNGSNQPCHWIYVVYDYIYVILLKSNRMIKRITNYLVWLIDPGLIVGRSGPDALCLGQSHVLVVVALDEEELSATEDILQLRRLVRGATTARLWSNLVGWLNHFCNTSHLTSYCHTSLVTVTPH